jgi:hypothetical protein
LELLRDDFFINVKVFAPPSVFYFKLQSCRPDAFFNTSPLVRGEASKSPLIRGDLEGFDAKE